MKDLIGRALKNVIEGTREVIERQTANLNQRRDLPHQNDPRDDSEQEEDMGADSVMQRMLWRVRSHEVRSHVLDVPPSKYTRSHSVRLQALTYNVNGKKPPPGLSLAGWLDPGEGDHSADVIAIGLQELVPLNAGNVITGGEDRAAAAAWVDLISAALNNRVGEGFSLSDGCQYVCMAEKQLVGVYLTVWAHVRMLPHIRGIQIATVATGFGGVLANKGAIAVRMRLYDTGVCFVAAHLSSGESATAAAGRLRDFSEILRRIEFPAEGREPAPGGAVRVPPPPSSSSAPGPDDDAADADEFLSRSALVVGPSSRGDWGLSVNLRSSCHHHIVFLGDMNFRVAMGHLEALKLIREGRLEELLKCEGLRLARMTEEGGQLLSDWREGRIRFPPTYKFRIGSNEYAGPLSKAVSSGIIDDSASSQSDFVEDSEFSDEDAKQENKVRTPSWTDRILWRSSRPGLQQVSYRSGSQTVSDHRPVSAAFLLQARSFDLDEVAKLVDEGWHELDLAVMAAMPRCNLEPRVIDFGNIEVGLPSTRTAVLKNMGSTAAHFRFIETPGLQSDGSSSVGSLSKVTPPWLQIDPMEGVVEEGCEIDICLSVDVSGGPRGCANYVVQQLNRSLEQVLVLHIAGGSDFFMALNGFLMPSVFGVPLDALPGTATGGGDDHGGVPQAVLSLTDFLLANGRLRAPGIFLGPAVPSAPPAPRSLLDDDMPAEDVDDGAAASGLSTDERLQVIRRALSSGSAVPDSTEPLDAAAVLLQLFSELPRPLMPSPAVAITDVCVPSYEAAMGLLKDGMSPVQWSTFVHVVELMREALGAEVAAESGLTPSAASMLLADAWFPPLPQHYGWMGRAGGATDRTSAVDAMELVADSSAGIQQRRADFLALFLDSDGGDGR